MTGPTRHEITIRVVAGFDGRDWWRSRSSCGEYKSGRFGSPGQAESAGLEHANAKNGARR